MSPITDVNSSTNAEAPCVRLAVQADASAITRIYNHHVDLGGSTFDKEHWTEQQVERLLAGSVPEVWLVAEIHGSIAGWASARCYSMRHGYRYTLETAIYLDSFTIGKGLGSALQQNLESHCRRHHIHHLVAKIAADNQRSMAFHYRHGYELVGIQKEIGHMDGQWQDVAILQKLLPHKA